MLGFTLVELIIVIGIISIMASAMLAILNPYEQIKKANDSKRKADLSQIQKALESYYQDNGKYPNNNPPTTYKIYDEIQNKIIDWNSAWQPYMNLVPKDSKPGYNYVYYVTTDLQSYYLYASLERGAKDAQACSGGLCSSPEGSGINMTTACGSGINCNYGVSTPDKNP